MPLEPFNCKFDAIFSISSFEHDGLGRYGDPVSPDSDLRSIKKLVQYLEPETGLLYLSVPVGRDELFWNEGRVYGAHRLPLLLDSWTPVSAFGVPIDAVRSADGPALVASKLRHSRISPNEAFQPVIVCTAKS